MKRYQFDYTRTTKKSKGQNSTEGVGTTTTTLAKICSECRQNDTEKCVLQCEECLGWFHPSCLHFKQGEFSIIDPWICPACEKERDQHPNIYESALKRFQICVSPQDGWGDEVIFDDLPNDAPEKRAKNDNIKKEGYKLFRQGKLRNFQSNAKPPFAFFHAIIDDAPDVSYDVWVCIKSAYEVTKLKWCQCFCPIGANGDCQHVVALLYALLDVQLLGLTKLPSSGDNRSWPRIWRQKKVEVYEPMLVSEIFAACNNNHNSDEDEELDENSEQFIAPITRDKLQKLLKNLEIIDESCFLVQALKDSDCVPKLDRNVNPKLVKKIWKFVIETEAPPVNPWLENLSENEQKLLDLIEVDLEVSKIIQKQTAHSQGGFWRKRTPLRITTRVFGALSKLVQNGRMDEIVKTYIQKSNYARTASDHHYWGNEPNAFALFQVKTGMKLHSSIGFIVNPNFSFLIANPDRLVQIQNKLYLVLIKCPYSIHKNKEKIRSRAKNGDFYLNVVPDEETEELKLNPNSDVYYEIQGQLLVCNLPVCFLVVYVPPDDIEILLVTRDNDFISQRLLPQLTNVYFDKLLPYYVQEICGETECKIKMEIE